MKRTNDIHSYKQTNVWINKKLLKDKKFMNNINEHRFFFSYRDN
jgi:hypothetical protein